MACPGCSAHDMWDADAGVPILVPDLVDRIVTEIDRDRLDGLTITGGEPTDQADALAAVVVGVRDRLPDLDILVFTGRPLVAARARAGALMDAATCVVAGPYRREVPMAEHRLLATANQELVISPAAADRYATWLADADAVRLQVMAADGDLYLVGLPAPGDLDRFTAELADRGVTLGGVSW